MGCTQSASKKPFWTEPGGESAVLFQRVSPCAAGLHAWRCFMWRFMLLLCLQRYGQYRHWSCGSLPHSTLRCCFKLPFQRYTFPQRGHSNRPGDLLLGRTARAALKGVGITGCAVMPSGRGGRLPKEFGWRGWWLAKAQAAKMRERSFRSSPSIHWSGKCRNVLDDWMQGWNPR